MRRHDFVTLAHKRNSLMSTSDETYVALRHFQKLRSSAPTIWSEMTKPDLGQVRSRLVSWLREARETARVLLGADCYVVAELDKLIPGNDGPLDFEDLKGLKEKALALLDSAERLTAVRSDNSISADLRRTIDTSVKEGYISSWPVKAMLAATAALLAILFGGTVYSTFKVDGVLKEAEHAILRITEKVAAFDKQAAETNQRLQSQIDEAIRAAAANKIKELEPIVAQAKVAIETEQDKQIKAFRDSVSPAVENAKNKLDDYLRRAPDEIQKTIAAPQRAAIQAIEANQDEAKKVLDTRRANAVTAIDGTEKAATAAIMNYQAAVNSARGTVETEMSQATSAINNLQKNTQTLINSAKDEVEARGKGATDQIDKIVATIPERVRKTGDSVVALNDLLAKYEAPVAAVIARLQAN